MTEIQGAVSGLLARIAHPEEVVARSNAQHAELVGLLRKRDADKQAVEGRSASHILGTEHILAGLI